MAGRWAVGTPGCAAVPPPSTSTSDAEILTAQTPVTQDLLTIVLLVLAGFTAGIINAIAGGGSLITLPLLIFIGLPATVANATNRIGVLLGGVGATLSFHRKGLIPREWIVLGTPPALVGVVFGTWGAMQIGDIAFQRVLAGVLVATAGWSSALVRIMVG